MTASSRVHWHPLVAVHIWITVNTLVQWYNRVAKKNGRLVYSGNFGYSDKSVSQASTVIQVYTVTRENQSTKVFESNILVEWFTLITVDTRITGGTVVIATTLITTVPGPYFLLARIVFVVSNPLHLVSVQEFNIYSVNSIDL